jgi:hypothetical protein
MILNKSTRNKCTKAILQTVIYSDLFDFPLNGNEIWYLLKSSNTITKSEFLESLKNLPTEIRFHKNYYSLLHRENIIAQREKRKAYSDSKYQLAKNTIDWLSFIPSIYFIGISGSVAHHNADESDDIDFFIVASKNTVWITRLITLAFLQFMGMRRSRKSQNEKNKICLNMILDEKHLLLPSARRDVFTAHEIAQLEPLFERRGTYKKFILENRWILTLMPNVIESSSSRSVTQKISRHIPAYIVYVIISHLLLLFSNTLFEKIARSIQLRQINKHRTVETITNTLLAFHPYDHRKNILSQYSKKIELYKLL